MAEPTPAPPNSSGWFSAERLAFVTFIAFECASFVLLLHVGSRRWFGFDDWDFLASRHLRSLDDLLAPHLDHWMAVPFVSYRILLAVFGLNFAAFLTLQIILHTLAAALLRVVMRRSGVGPWIATLAAGVYALFGTGWDFSTQAFGIVLSLPTCLGLAALILADHDGPFDRRDWLAAGTALLAVMSSSVGLIFVLALGFAVWLRRRFRTALVLAGPAIIAFLTWRVAADVGSDSQVSPLGIIAFAVRAVAATVRSIGQSTIVAILLGAIIIFGFILTAADAHWRGLRRIAPMPSGLLVGFLGWWIAVGAARIDGVTPTDALLDTSHYLDVAAIFLLPSVAFAIAAVTRHSRPVGVISCLVLIVGVPANVRIMMDGSAERQNFAVAIRETLLRAARNPIAEEVPRSVRPEPIFAYPVTIGWLLDQHRAGRLPGAPPPSPELASADELRLSLAQTSSTRIAGSGCRPVGRATRTRLARGESVVLAGLGTVSIRMRTPNGWSPAVGYGLTFGAPLNDRELLTAVRRPLDLLIEPDANARLRICRPKSR